MHSAVPGCGRGWRVVFPAGPGALGRVIVETLRAQGARLHIGDISTEALAACRKAWDEALNPGEVHGYRNAQATVLAPTGTIGFMMDCDTTGIEPDLALVKIKRLVGGGTIKIVNQTVSRALGKLGYDFRILEARDRVGGLNWTARRGTTHTEIGGETVTAERDGDDERHSERATDRQHWKHLSGQ